MTRSGGAIKHLKRAKVFAQTKGFYGKRKNCYTQAVRAAERSMQNNFIGRKEKKRNMRQLWVTRVGIAAREQDMPYSHFIDGLVKANVQLNRKVLSELAVHEPKTFQALAELAKQSREQASLGLKGLL
eukprot:m.357567 g.357567  ORF g.357567 m.357567 type:complete len:128 (+) comp17866_c0_seq1:30-413(+)